VNRSRATGPRLPLSPLVALATVLVSSVLAPAGVKSYRDLRAARQREAVLQQRIEETEARVQKLEHRLRRLADDPTILERLAREDLGLVIPGDVVIVLPEEDGVLGFHPRLNDVVPPGQ
jgi:cell division protein FtsB